MFSLKLLEEMSKRNKKISSILFFFCYFTVYCIQVPNKAEFHSLYDGILVSPVDMVWSMVW